MAKRHITHDKATGKWILWTKDGKKKLGEHPTKEAALAQEAAIEANKSGRGAIEDALRELHDCAARSGFLRPEESETEVTIRRGGWPRDLVCEAFFEDDVWQATHSVCNQAANLHWTDNLLGHEHESGFVRDNYPAVYAEQASLVRDIFGNPFRPVAFDATWGTLTVKRLAETIYDQRTFDRLPILADALEDAGCDDAEILGHCRGPGPHVHGCFVVDLLLGKE